MQNDCDAENCEYICRIFKRLLTMFSKLSKDKKVYLDTLRYILVFHPSLLTTVITLNIILTFLLLSAFFWWGKEKRGGGNRKCRVCFHGVLVFHFLIFLNHFEIDYLQSCCSTHKNIFMPLHFSEAFKQWERDCEHKK